MQIDVYDTYARCPDGSVIHFDVMMPRGKNQQLARQYAQQWLQGLNIQFSDIALEVCEWCHAESASVEIMRQIQSQGYAVINLGARTLAD